MRNMSFALTVPQIQAGTKDVTRRMGWLQLKPGELFLPVRKCMGLKPGEKIEPIRGPLRVANVRRKFLRRMTDDIDYGFDEVRREGFADHPIFRFSSEWVAMFCSTHKGCEPGSFVTRIEFAYED